MRVLYLVTLVALGAAGFANSAEAIFRFDPRNAMESRNGAHASIGARTAAPFGSILFCRHRPGECRVHGASGVQVSGGRVVLNDQVRATIRSVNSSVNRSIRPVADRGNADKWSIGGAAGDCEDFALTKRAALIRKGFPSSATLIATAETRRGTGHAVLVVRTDRGNFVLDSASTSVVPFSSAPYSWESIQSPKNPKVWMRL